MYRPPSRPPRGAWAKHIHDRRRERGLSQTQAFELLYEGLGLSPKSRSAYLAIDMGVRQPNEREAAYLATVFGWPPEGPPEPPGATETPEGLVAALNAQTAAIVALVDELRLARVAQVEQMTVAFEALGALGRGQDRGGTLDGNGNEDPVGTVR